MSDLVAGEEFVLTREVVTWWGPRGVDGVTNKASMKYLITCFLGNVTSSKLGLGILPAPVALDRDSVCSSVQQGLTSRDSRPSSGFRQAHVTTSTTVERNPSGF